MTGYASKKHDSLDKFRCPIRLEKVNDIFINPDYLDLLTRLDFTEFDSVWNCHKGETFKKIQDRSVTRIDIEHNGKKNVFYLKRHNPEQYSMGYRYFPVFFTKPLTQGFQELINIIEFRNHGLSTVVPVAAGEKLADKSNRISFLITEDFSPFLSLEWILFNQPGFFTGSKGEKRKTCLLEVIGHFARKMHNAGFNHKDFNATHILLHFPESSPEKPDMALFDLQRVGRKNLLSFRWIIKSLAEINYTLPEQYFSDYDRQQLFNAYRGHQRPDCSGKLLQWWIRRKAFRIARHTKKIVKRRQSLK